MEFADAMVASLLNFRMDEETLSELPYWIFIVWHITAFRNKCHILIWEEKNSQGLIHDGIIIIIFYNAHCAELSKPVSDQICIFSVLLTADIFLNSLVQV